MRKIDRARVIGLVAGLALIACGKDGGPEPSPPDAGPSEPDVREIGAKAIAQLSPLAPDADGNGVNGTARFSQTPGAVTASLIILQCSREAKPYQVLVKEGVDCSEATLSGPNWDRSRGEGVQPIQCEFTSMGRAFYERPNDADEAWSIGAPAKSDLLGHALVVVDGGTGMPVACGTIVRDDTAPAQPAPAPHVLKAEDIELLAPIAGLCLGKDIAQSDASDCANPERLVTCAAEHCEVASCYAVCNEYIACMSRASDVCTAAIECPLTQACADCQQRVQSCVLGFCVEELVCPAPATPDGPCSQLKACCARQGDAAAACLETVELLEKFSGDPSCAAALKSGNLFADMNVVCDAR